MLRIFAFLLDIIFCMLFVVLYDTLTFFLLKIFDRGLEVPHFRYKLGLSRKNSKSINLNLDFYYILGKNDFVIKNH